MLATAEHYFWLIDSLRLKKKGGGRKREREGEGGRKKGVSLLYYLIQFL